MKLTELQGKKILIVGYGVEGKATHAFLKKYLPELEIGIADAKDGEQYLSTQKDYDIAIKSPGVASDLLTIPYTTATNLFFGNAKGMTIGVTGTKGKSTTASLIAAILKEAGKKVMLVGNIGTPMLEALDLHHDAETTYVIELSSYQLEDITYSPHIAAIINLYAEHMDHHGSVQSYWEAKKRIVAQSTPRDYFVYHTAFPELVALAKQTHAKAVPVIDGLPFDAKHIPLLGTHNQDNVRVAVTVCQILDIPVTVMEHAVRSFVPLPHRLQPVGTYNGITFYDDAISTTPESAMAAIDAVGPVGTIFLGGQDRGYDFHGLVQMIAEKKIPNVVLFPDSGAKIKSLLSAFPVLPSIVETRSMKEAVAFAYGNTPSGTVCLLSCASPSYSLWKNFSEKGDEFQRYVRELGVPAA